MKVLYVTSEAVPFVKTGGLADVTGTLPVAMERYMEKTWVIMPRYANIDAYFSDSMTHVCDFFVQLGWRNQYCGIDVLEHNGVEFLFVDNKYYFGRDYIYGSMCMDECERFSFFNTAVAEAIRVLDISPDIVHCNDWQCGMVPYLLKKKYKKPPRTAYTIHNIHYQGIFPWEWVNDFLSIPEWDSYSMRRGGNISFMQAGIVHADAVSTVSPTYAKEIMSCEIGEGLQDVLSAKRPPVYGILNGLDCAMFSPHNDIHIEHHYSDYAMEGKELCKSSLQYELWLENAPNTPLLSIVSRLTEQKGLKLIENTWEKLMECGVQLAVIGTGDKHFEDFFRWLSSRMGGRVAARIEYNERMSRRIYAGSDIFLMPSRTEPCGLAQMIALRYGTVPVVHETGGLRDTVVPYNKYTGEGSGFSFFDYNEEQFLGAVYRALECYHDKCAWEKLRLQGMRQNFSWEASALRYHEMYSDILNQ
ncbi:MAG: glycogen synthase [Clostridia bacterium]|nr:glycogen synthase [Clostridia bacterium]